MEEKEFIDNDFYNEIFKEGMDEYYKHLKEIESKNKKAIKEVKKLIDYPFARIKEALEYCEWQDQGYVEVEITDYKDNNYPNYVFYQVIGEYTKYMRQDEDKKIHNLVWKTSSFEDCYSGEILFPLSN